MGIRAVIERKGFYAYPRTIVRNARQRPGHPLTWNEAGEKAHRLIGTLNHAKKLLETLVTRSPTADEVGEWKEAGAFEVMLTEVDEAIRHFQDQLVRLADAGSVFAVKKLAGSSLHGANELLKLSRRDLARVRLVAASLPCWPVNYSPHPDDRAQLEELVKRLGVASKSPERKHGDWTNRPGTAQAHRAVIGGYATRMGVTLRMIHMDKNIRMASFSTRGRGWPAWMKRLVRLRPLTHASAPDWFACGWKALTEAAGGSVADIPVLRPVGDADAAYRKRRQDSVKIQEQVRLRRIRQTLRAAFLARWGN